MIRRICVATTTRADYGLLRWVMHEIRARPELQLQILATGTHLSPQFGMTVDEIVADGFEVDARVDIQPLGNSELDVAAAMARALDRGAPALSRLAPDLLLVLGDRYEVFALAAAATVLRLPIGHIAGGDVTEGAFDEALRHSITKMAHLHFVTNAQARARVLQMGEDPSRVHTVGSPGIDSILRAPQMSRAEIEQALNFRLRPRNLLVTFHPATLDAEPAVVQCEELLAALDALGPDVGLIVTMPNADPEGLELARRLEVFAASRKNVALRTSLGSRLYLNTMRIADAVVGNSSSGLYEAPTLKRPTVNIGDRQRGRLAASSVIHCEPRRSAIVDAIGRAVALDCSAVVSPYGEGDSAPRIAAAIAAEPDYRALLQKRFHGYPTETRA